MPNFATPRLLIVANHESFLDGLLISLFLPCDPVFVIHTEIFQSQFFRFFLSFTDYLLVEPANPMAMKKVVKLLETGRPVMIFPEGRITNTGALMKIYEGPAFVAAKTDATILPIKLEGTAHSYFSRMPRTYPKQWFPRITLTLQPSCKITVSSLHNAHRRRQLAATQLRRLMQSAMCVIPENQTLYSALLSTMSLYGPRRQIIEDVKQTGISYRDLLKQILALGKLTSRLTAPQECIGLLMPNLAVSLSLMIGISTFKRVPAMLNYKAGSAALQDACTLGLIRTLITTRAFIEQAKLHPQLASLQGVQILYLEDLKSHLTWQDRLWVLATLLFPSRINRYADANAPAVVLFTSGSEGHPKGVVLSHRALLANIAQIRSVIDFSNQEKVFNALPIFHAFGLTGGALLPLLTGMKLFLYPTPLHYRIIPELVYDRGCTVLFGTSTFLNQYAKFAHPYDFHQVRYVVSGAEKLTESVRQLWLQKFGLRILEGYGATETAPVLCVNTPMAYRSGTVGQFLPGVSYQLASVDGITEGQRLYVQGPNLMSGYLHLENPGQLVTPQAAIGPGWHDTGDMVSVDEEGFVSIIGRVKRFAKIAGEMVSLEIPEKAAYHASGQAIHAATTQQNAMRGEAIFLFTTDPALTRDQVALAIRHLGCVDIAVPRSIHYLVSLPQLGNGKIDYVQLKQLAQTAPPAQTL